MHFLLDVNLSPKLIWEFQRLDHACDHVSTVLHRNAKDREIVEFANRHARTLVSKDADFVAYSKAGLVRYAVIWLRSGNMSAQIPVSLFAPACQMSWMRLRPARKSLRSGDRS